MTIPLIGIVAWAAFLTLNIFAIDLMIPLGIAGAVPYVGVVLLGLWLPKRRHVIILAEITTLATILGYFLSPAGGIEWMVLANRALAIFAIWVCALIVTLRKETQYELIVENRRAENYLDISDAIIVHLDPHQRIRRINDHGSKLLGYEAQELIGKDWMDLCIAKDTQEKVFAVHAQVLSGNPNQFAEFENDIITKSGERRHIAWKNKTEYDGLGQLAGTLSAGYDITDRKRAELNSVQRRSDGCLCEDPEADCEHHHPAIFVPQIDYKPDTSTNPANPRVELSKREKECLLWLARGLRNDRISEKLGVRPVTVEYHFQNCRKKLNASTREQALAIAITDGHIKP